MQPRLPTHVCVRRNWKRLISVLVSIVIRATSQSEKGLRRLSYAVHSVTFPSYTLETPTRMKGNLGALRTRVQDEHRFPLYIGGVAKSVLAEAVKCRDHAAGSIHVLWSCARQ
jgi:hypothetical protein